MNVYFSFKKKSFLMAEQKVLEQLQEVISNNDVEALKSGLQSLMVLFETQNRSYRQLKAQVIRLKKGPKLTLQECDSITIEGVNPENVSNTNKTTLDTAYEALATVRLSRKVQKEAREAIENAITKESDETTELK